MHPSRNHVLFGIRPACREHGEVSGGDKHLPVLVTKSDAADNILGPFSNLCRRGVDAVIAGDAGLPSRPQPSLPSRTQRDAPRVAARPRLARGDEQCPVVRVAGLAFAGRVEHVAHGLAERAGVVAEVAAT